MRKILVPNCRYAESPHDGRPLFCDVYVLLNDEGEMLWHENLFLADMAQRHSILTAKSRASDLLSFVEAMQSLGGWSHVTPQHMTGYIHGVLHQARRCKIKTIEHHVDTLKAFYNWLVTKGHLDIEPDFDWHFKHLFRKQMRDESAYQPAQHSFHSAYMDREQFEHLLTGVRGASPFIVARDELVLKLGYYCGLRAHEVLNFDTAATIRAIKDAKMRNKGLWAAASVWILGKGNKEREIILSPDLCERISNYVNRYQKNPFQARIPLICKSNGQALAGNKHASTVYADACRAAGIIRLSRQGFHCLRKCYGTNLVSDCMRDGRDPWVEVPRRMGHESYDTTKQYIYFEALLNGRSEVLSRLRMMDSRYKALQSNHKGKRASG